MRTFKLKMLIILALTMTYSVSSAQNATLEFKNAEASVKIVKDYVAALQSGDASKMTSYLAENAMVYGLGGGQDSLTTKQHREYFTESIKNYKHSISNDLYLPVKVTENWNEGEWVLTWGVNTITNKENGKVSTVRYHTASTVENGKISRIVYYYDMSNLLVSQGWSLTPPK